MPTISRATASVRLYAEVLGSILILVLILELGPGGVTGSIILTAPPVWSWYEEPRTPQEDLSSIKQQSEHLCRDLSVTRFPLDFFRFPEDV